MTAALHVLRADDKPTNFPAEGDDKNVHLDNSEWRVFDPEFAEMLRQDYPGVWGKGGNVLGNTQYRRLRPVAERGGKPETETEEEAVRLREAWGARHFDNNRLPGVVAQVKWFVVGALGEGGMKDLLREAMKREDEGRAQDIAAIVAADAERSRLRGLPPGYPSDEVPADVRAVAQAALLAGRGSLADEAMARRIVADAVTAEDLAVMASGEAERHGGGVAGAEWAAGVLRDIGDLHPFAWLSRSTVARPSSRAASTPESRAIYWHEYIRAVHRPGERRIAAAVASALRDWRDAIAERAPSVLGDVLPVRGLTPEQRVDLPAWLSSLIGAEEFGRLMRAVVGPQLLRVMEIAFRRTVRELGLSGVGWSPTIAPAGQAIGQLIVQVTATTVAAVSEMVTEAIAEGVAMQELQRRLMAMPEFGQVRALRIARTETGRVATAGTIAALDEAKARGIDIEDEWITARDEAVRESHKAMDGQTVPHGGRFMFPSGVSTAGPGQSMVAAEDINCRCAIRPRVKDPT